MARFFKTGTLQVDLELMIKYNGIKQTDILEITDRARNFSFRYEEFFNSISGVDYGRLSDIASPILVRTKDKTLAIYDNSCEILS